MMFSKIRAVHIAVKNLEEATKDFSENFNLEVSRTGTMPETGINNAFLPVGDAVIELIQPIDPEQGPVAKFIKNRGEGVYMMAMEVDNLDKAVEILKEKGVRLLDAEPEVRAKGGPVFIHPKWTHGLLIELVEKA
ncbi:MAG TPA: methylmalonyl-CoA epimerase [Dehalococcoidia bacterium]|nr:methylmalonyl-CoA epimerase [Dehalococcoidia bacterium]